MTESATLVTALAKATGAAAAQDGRWAKSTTGNGRVIRAAVVEPSRGWTGFEVYMAVPGVHGYNVSQFVKGDLPALQEALAELPLK